MDWRERAAALEPLGWRGRDAEWVTLVCLHSGVFLRGQYLAFIGRQNPWHGNELVKRLGKAAVEGLWNGSGRRVCRIGGRQFYEALGAEHVRHRRGAQRGVLLRRLLSLDYVLEHGDEPWLATEQEKVAGLLAAGVPEPALPRRVYSGTGSGVVRYFVHKLPVALDAARATFVFCQAEDSTPAAVRTWGEAHARLWAELGASGRSVEVVVVGRDPARLESARRVVDRWVEQGSAATPPSAAADELTELRSAVSGLNGDVLGRYDGLNGALERIAALETLAEAEASAAPAPAISRGETWRSVRVPE